MKINYSLEFFHPLEHFFILFIGQIIIVISSMPWVERVKPNPRTTIGYRTEQLFWRVHLGGYSDNSIKSTVLRPNRQYKASTAEMA